MSSQPHRLPRPNGNEKDGNQCRTLPFCYLSAGIGVKNSPFFWTLLATFLQHTLATTHLLVAAPQMSEVDPSVGCSVLGVDDPKANSFLLAACSLRFSRIFPSRSRALASIASLRSRSAASMARRRSATYVFEFRTYSFRYGKCLGNLVFKV